MKGLFKSSMFFLLFAMLSVSFVFKPYLVFGEISPRVEASDLYKEKLSVVEVFNQSKEKQTLSESEIYLMAQTVFAESRSEPYEGKVAVASVILNRLNTPGFPHSIEGIIKQKNAFSCVTNGKINVTPDQSSYSAVLSALKGNDPTSKAVFFYNPNISTCSWMKNVPKQNSTTIGNHVFFKTK